MPCGLTGLEVRGEVEQAVEEVGGEGDTGEEEEEEEWPSMALFMSVREWRAASGPELPPAKCQSQSLEVRNRSTALI